MKNNNLGVWRTHGKFDAGEEVKHVQGGKIMRLSQPQQMMAQERHIVEEAYAGDKEGVRQSKIK